MGIIEDQLTKLMVTSYKRYYDNEKHADLKLLYGKVIKAIKDGDGDAMQKIQLDILPLQKKYYKVKKCKK